MTIIVRVISACVLACLYVGCGPKTSHLTGTVSMQGSTLCSGAVTFIPRRMGGRATMVPINSDGSFTIDVDHGGIAPGTYDVTVSCWEAPATPAPPAGSVDGSTPLGKSLIPVRYADPKTSGLTCTVWSFGVNRLAIDLVECP